MDVQEMGALFSVVHPSMEEERRWCWQCSSDFLAMPAMAGDKALHTCRVFEPEQLIIMLVLHNFNSLTT